jgi:hypothetical protein
MTAGGDKARAAAAPPLITGALRACGRGRAARRVRGRCSGLKGAGASPCGRRPCGPPLTPETSAAPGQETRAGREPAPTRSAARRATLAAALG